MYLILSKVLEIQKQKKKMCFLHQRKAKYSLIKCFTTEINTCLYDLCFNRLSSECFSVSETYLTEDFILEIWFLPQGQVTHNTPILLSSIDISGLAVKMDPNFGLEESWNIFSVTNYYHIWHNWIQTFSSLVFFLCCFIYLSYCEKL